MSCFDQTLTANTKQHTFDVANPDDLRMIQHLYNRLSFGARKIDIEYADGKTIAQVVDDIIDTALDETIVPIPDDNVFFWAYTTNKTDPFSAFCENNCDNPHSNNSVFNPCDDPCENPISAHIGVQRRAALKSEWVVGMTGKNIANDSITEKQEIERDVAKSFKYKLVLFWHNHFVIQDPVPFAAIADIYTYYFILHNNALKNFKQFTKEVGFCPAMMRYLNVYKSSATLPNENYARELLELFTMGLNNPDTNEPNYTEGDIKAIARLLTGWNFGGNSVIIEDPANILNVPNCLKYCTLDNCYWDFNSNGDTYPFIRNNHDWETKTFLNGIVTANTNPMNQNIQAGLNEYHQLHDIMFDNRSRSIAHFICTKLYKKYVCHDITEDAQTFFINELANIFENNWEIAPVLKKIFKSEHFYDEILMGCQIKSPVDYMISFYRLADLEFNKDYFSHARHFEPNAVVSLFDNDDFGYQKPVSNPKENYHNSKYIVNDVAALGQILFTPPNVGGWTEHHSWLNEYTYTNRWVKLKKHFDEYFHDSLNNPQLWDTWESIRLFIKDLSLYQKQTFSDPNLIVETILEHFFVVDMSHRQAASVEVFMQAVPMEEMSYWNLDTDNTYHTRQDVKDQLKDLFSYLIKQPEFNLI